VAFQDGASIRIGALYIRDNNRHRFPRILYAHHAAKGQKPVR